MVPSANPSSSPTPAAAGHATTLLTFRPGGALSATVSSAVVRITLQPFDVGLDWFAPGLGRAARAHVFDVILCLGRMANCYAGGLQNRLPATAVVGTMRTGKRLPALFRASSTRSATSLRTATTPAPPSSPSMASRPKKFPSFTTRSSFRQPAR